MRCILFLGVAFRIHSSVSTYGRRRLVVTLLPRRRGARSIQLGSSR